MNKYSVKELEYLRDLIWEEHHKCEDKEKKEMLINLQRKLTEDIIDKDW